jgi:hypothetical protein
MPPVTRFALRAALAYLVLGALAASAYWLNTAWRVAPALQPLTAALSPTYVHLIVVGWLTQFIMGVMHWMFPIRSRAMPRGDERVMVAAIAFLNGGLLLRVIAEPWRSLQPGGLNAGLLVLSAVMQTIACLSFAAAAWPRVRERGGF